MENVTSDNNTGLSLVIIAEGENTYAESLIESIRICCDYDDISVILYDNTQDKSFRQWASEQTDFLFAYGENGILPYGEIFLNIIDQIGIRGDVLLIPDAFLLIPGTLSGMVSTMYGSENIGLLGGNFNGNYRYGLGKESTCRNYNELSQLSLSNDYRSWDTDTLDENGPILINKGLIEKLFHHIELRDMDARSFRNSLCDIASQYGLRRTVDAHHYWWNCCSNYGGTKTEEKKKPFFTIGIPTYNRGHRALDTVNQLLKDRARYHMEYEVEIFVSDNASENNTEGYERIKELSEDNINLVYYRADSNGLLLGNIYNIISLAKGQFCLLLSDEDMVFFAGLICYIKYLEKHAEIAVMKGWSNANYQGLRPIYQPKGVGALSAFYLKGNYISGIIWNRSIITGELILELKRRYDDEAQSNRAFLYYNHMFLDAYGLIHGAYAGSDIPLINEGDSEIQEINMKTLPYTTPEERIRQAEGFMMLIRDVGTSDNIAATMYLLTVEKTLYLLNMSKSDYSKAGFNWNSILLDFKKRIMTAYDILSLEKSELLDALVFDTIETLVNNCMDME
ncbi:MAG: glycosyltransferase [Lachnospiraceae bacterium]|nr:glycosyltransferase [Lachnospiraceae bacterium]